MQSLAEEYRIKQKEMDDRLKKEIENHKVASVFIQDNQRPLSAGAPLQPIKIADNNQAKQPLLPFEKKPAQFVRSNRSIAMRIKEDYEGQINALDQEKVKLIKRLNEAILELDKINQEKGELNDKLISLFQFTRDVERHTLRSDDLLHVVDESLKEEMRCEKQQSVCLREQIKMNEQERFHFRDQLRNSEHYHEQLNQDKIECQHLLEQREREYNNLSLEYQEILAQIQLHDQEINELNQMCIELHEKITGHRRDLHYTNGGRLSLKDQFEHLDRKYLQTVEIKDRELRDIKYRHMRRMKLIATKIISERLLNCHLSNIDTALNQIKRFSNLKYSILNGCNVLRKMMKKNRRNKLNNALYIWYNQSLNPLKNLIDTRKAGKVLFKRNSIHKFFYKWRSQFRLSNTNHFTRLSSLMQIIVKKITHQNEVKKSYLVRWRNAVNLRYTDWQKIQAFKKLLTIRDSQILRSRLYRWKALIVDLEYQIQQRAMIQRITLKHFVSRVFQAWSFTATQSKFKRQNTLHRIWRAWFAFVSHQKQFRYQALLILRESRVRVIKNQLKACFDSLKLHKQNQKFRKVKHLLENVELPLIDQTKLEILQVYQDQEQRQREFCIKNLLIQRKR